MTMLDGNAPRAMSDVVQNRTGVRGRNNRDKIVLVLDVAAGADVDALRDLYKDKLRILSLESIEGAEGEDVRTSSGSEPVLSKALHPTGIKHSLSARQQDVLKLIARGMSNKEIARELRLAEGTVKIHVAALFGKLGVHRRAAVAMAGFRFLSATD